MYNLVTIGDPVIDTHVQLDDGSGSLENIKGKVNLCFEFGAKIPIIDSFQSLGGNAANVAAAAVKLGMKTALVSTIGGDSNGRVVFEELAKYNVDTEYVKINPKSKTRYSIVLNYKTDRTILSYSDKKNYDWPKPFPETEWIYYTGVSNGHEKLHANLCALVQKHKTIRLAFNPGSYMLKFALDEVKELVQRADLLIVNVQEAERILGTNIKKEKSAAALLHKLLTHGAKEIVITDGARGAWAGDKDETWHMESYSVPVVAKTGAGDAFSAGYIAARSCGHDIAHALQWGIANSCAVIAEHGPHKGLLDEEGVMAMIQQFQTIKPQSIS